MWHFCRNECGTINKCICFKLWCKTSKESFSTQVLLSSLSDWSVTIEILRVANYLLLRWAWFGMSHMIWHFVKWSIRFIAQELIASYKINHYATIECEAVFPADRVMMRPAQYLYHQGCNCKFKTQYARGILEAVNLKMMERHYDISLTEMNKQILTFRKRGFLALTSAPFSQRSLAICKLPLLTEL